jgi:hypothetical protein
MGKWKGLQKTFLSFLCVYMVWGKCTFRCGPNGVWRGGMIRITLTIYFENLENSSFLSFSLPLPDKTGYFVDVGEEISVERRTF